MKSKKRKILHVITKGNWGGAQRYVFDLASRLPSDQFESVVVHGEGALLPEKLTAAGIRTIRIESLGRDVHMFKDVVAFKNLLSIFETEQPDIVHLNGSKIGGIGALAARVGNVPKIMFTGHGWAWNEDRSFFSKALITLVHWLTIQMCHHTIAVSKETKRQIMRLPFISDEKIVVIPNGIAEIDFEEKHAARSKIGGGSEKVWIGTIAELHKNKGLDILIEAFSRLDVELLNVGLYIIGGGEEKKALEVLAREKGVEHRVRFVGFVPAAAMLLKAFDIFVLPSRTEAFPYVILEAGLAQLPVIASSVGGIPEVIIHRETGLLFPSGDIAELTRNITRLMTDTALVAEISQGIRKEVENKFTIERMVAATIAVYNR